MEECGGDERLKGVGRRSDCKERLLKGATVRSGRKERLKGVRERVCEGSHKREECARDRTEEVVSRTQWRWLCLRHKGGPRVLGHAFQEKKVPAFFL